MKTSRAISIRLPRHVDAWSEARSVAKAMWQRFNERRLVGLASESAFWVLLALVPLAAVSGMFAARIALSNGVALGLLSRSLPLEARELLSNELTKVASYNGGRLGLVASIVFVWLASSGVHAIFDVFEAASDCSPRSWVRKRVLSIVCCFALAVGMAAIAVLVGDLENVARALGGGRPHTLSHAELAIRLALGAVVDLLLTAGLYRVGVATKKGHSTLFPGAALAVALQVVLGASYASFIRALGDGSTYLAGLAVFGVTMTAVFIYMLSLLLGLTLNTILADHWRTAARHRHFEPQ